VSSLAATSCSPLHRESHRYAPTQHLATVGPPPCAWLRSFPASQRPPPTGRIPARRADCGRIAGEHLEPRPVPMVSLPASAQSRVHVGVVGDLTGARVSPGYAGPIGDMAALAENASGIGPMSPVLIRRLRRVIPRTNDAPPPRPARAPPVADEAAQPLNMKLYRQWTTCAAVAPVSPAFAEYGAFPQLVLGPQGGNRPRAAGNITHARLKQLGRQYSERVLLGALHKSDFHPVLLEVRIELLAPPQRRPRNKCPHVVNAHFST